MERLDQEKRGGTIEVLEDLKRRSEMKRELIKKSGRYCRSGEKKDGGGGEEGRKDRGGRGGRKRRKDRNRKWEDEGRRKRQRQE